MASLKTPLVTGSAGLAGLFVLLATAYGAEVMGKTSVVYPPWQQGRNNDALDRGLQFTIPEVDNLADFHGDLTAPKLVLYVGGNYFFAMAPLVEAFEEEHPAYRGRLFWETIPPGRLVEQIKSNVSGNQAASFS
jgi:hypothetical protein